MKRLLSVALMVLVTLVGMVGFSRAGEAVGTLQATDNASGPVKPKMYYLTKNTFNGGDTFKACDPRFHMASISEIQDPSNLQYAKRSTSVYDSLVDDEGLGPPSNQMGWVRSGVYPPSGLVYDCHDFWDNRDNQSGTTVTLNAYSSNPAPDQPASHPNMWWHAVLHPCSQPEPVWCIEDPE